MTAYDPQARRARPSPSDESPVDGLLEPVPVVDAVPDDVSDDVSDVSDEAPATALETESEELKPFETPQVEMTDERADLLHRLGALGAVVALVVALMLWRRRRAD